MSRVCLPLLLILLMPGSVLSDTSDLEGGVLIAHHPTGLQYSNGQDWCARYLQEFAIDVCSQQNNRIDLDGNDGEESVWFVLAAWDEEKQWCGTEFGFAEYDSTIYLFDQWGPCPSSALAIPTPGWPGPDQGIALSLPDTTWTGNFVPVCWFAGYAYDQGTIALAANPATGFGGTANCEIAPATFAAIAFGGMGILQDGTYACPEGLDGGGGLDGGTQPDGGDGYGGYEPDGGQDSGSGDDGCIRYEEYMHLAGHAGVAGARDATVSGDHAYVAAGASGLKIVDIFREGSFAVVGDLDTPGSANGVSVAGQYAYVADAAHLAAGDSLRVIDVSDPTSPLEVASLSLPGQAMDVAVAGEHAYVVINTPSPSLRVVDVTDPEQPEIVAAVTLAAPWSIVLSGDHAYVADSYAGLKVIDISSPTEPHLVGVVNTPGLAHGVAVSGSHAYVADCWAGLQVIDIATPESPQSVGQLTTPSYALDVAVSSDYAYVACRESGLLAVDVSELQSPIIAGQMSTPGLAGAVACAGGIVLVALDDKGLDVIDADYLETPPTVGSGDTPGAAADVAVEGQYAYVADGANGLTVMNVADPENPEIVGSAAMPAAALAVDASGTGACVAVGASGVAVVDVTDPYEPVVQCVVDTPGAAVGVAVVGDYAYVADQARGLQIIDLSLEAPAIVGHYEQTLYGAVAVVVSGSHAYVSAVKTQGIGAAQLWVIDVSDPELPAREGCLVLSCASVGGAAVEGSYVYVGGWPGLYAVDVANSGQPSVADSVVLPYGPRDVAVCGVSAYVADELGGLQVIDVADPEALELLGGAVLPARASGVAVSDSLAYVAADSSGLQILPLQCQPPEGGEPEWVDLAGGQPFSVEVEQGSQGTIVVEMTLAGFYAIPEEINGTTFYHIALPGEPVRMEAGAPELPFVPRSLLISDDQLMSATVDSAAYVDIPAMPVAPSKGPLPMGVSADSVAYNFGAAYTDSAYYPAAAESLATPFILRDFRGQILQLNAFQAYPVDSMLRVYTYLKVSVTPSGPDTRSIIERSGPPAVIDRQFARIYERFFANYPAVCLGGYHPDTIEEELLIVVPHDCSYCDGPIAELVDWKTQRGLVTEVVSTGIMGSGTCDDIRQYLRTRYQQNQFASVLLVGDADQVPPFIAGEDPEDPPYTLMDDDDNFPDIFVGRFSANNVEQLQTQVERTILYERDLGTDAVWLGQAFGMATDSIVAPPSYDDNTDVMEDLMGRLHDTGNYATTHLFDDEHVNEQVDYLLSRVNEGQGIMLVSDHGCVDGWDADFPKQPEDPKIMRREQVHTEGWLHNSQTLPLIHAASCLLGRFTTIDTPSDPFPTECFAESWMWEQSELGLPQGAIATYMSGGELDQYGSQYAQLGTVLALLDEDSPSIGQMLYFGSVFMLLQGIGAGNFNMWNVFGDPSLIFRKSVPLAMSATHAGYLRPEQEVYDVTVCGAPGGAPVAGACCAVSGIISGERVLFGVGVTDQNGKASIELAPREEPIELTLTVTAGTRVTYTGAIQPGLLVDTEGQGDATTIQAALAAADDDWVIVLGNPEYRGDGNRDLDCGGKGVTIAPQDTLGCLIDCESTLESPHFGFSFGGASEGKSLTLRGLTIANARHVDSLEVLTDGGAVDCHLGGGTCDLAAQDCIFEANAGRRGGAIRCEGAVTLDWCTFAHNEATETGGALWCAGTLDVEHCTFAHNAAGTESGGSAIYCDSTATGTMTRAILASGEGGGAVGCAVAGQVGLGCSDIFDNVGGDDWGCMDDLDGNFSADPKFCSVPGVYEYMIDQSSPCNQQGGEACPGLIGAWGVGCTDESGVDELAASMGPGIGSIAPTPSVGRLRIRYTAGGAGAGSDVELCIYDLTGRLVRTLVSGACAGGVQMVVWDGTDARGNAVGSGTYFCRMAVGGKEVTQRIILLR